MMKNFKGTGIHRLTEIARQLRKDETASEKIFWNLIRGRKHKNLKFRRQHPLGKYILDFYCVHKKLAIEIDGETHSNHEQKILDSERDQYLKSIGIRILRVNSDDVFNKIDSVFARIDDLIEGD